ncbi:MAG: DNA replication protein DnaC, partial [Lachnospiraceae bacterium]|nr:DNA replication protein DnaC [Lachnospiraceae bacterium]
MGLSNSQYDSIIRTYEAVRDKNRRSLLERIDYVNAHVTGFQELEATVGLISVQHGKQYLLGDENALITLK